METKTVAFFRQGLGNFIEFTPALRAMASTDPSGKIDLCTSLVWSDHRKEAMEEIAKRLPFINSVLSIDDIDEVKYKTWFWTPWTLCGDGELFKKKKPYAAPKWDQGKKHESDYYLDIARNQYGYHGEKPKQMIVPALKPLIDKKGKKLVVLCNGGFAQLSVFKRWDGFTDFSKILKSFFPDVLTAKIGLAGELDNVNADLDFTSKLSFVETAKVIQQADLMVTTDTGSMHVADALGIPMIVLWGGAVLEKNRPYEAMNKIVHLGLKCQPCINRVAYRFCKDFKCIRGIGIGEVMYHVRNFFKKGNFNDS